MPTDLVPQPSPEWRAAQHRIRNDLQTLAALLRLSRRRAPDSALVEQYPDWLSVLAALYDALPLWEGSEEIALEGIARALLARGRFASPLFLEGGEDATIAVQSALAAALCLHGLFTFSCRSAAPGGTVRVSLTADLEALRAETAFPSSGGAPAGWPPLSLSLASEALDGRYSVDTAGEETVAVLLIPRR